ncbi:ribonuclease P protein component [Gilvimarinus polysaccharolyticus]|uniref:ribonuclease P protein component n=1 Tax=Gilvimarinus polysaccharolyticus TaxID=863921 RepID=UPI0006739EC3|nr:ribonuclease P protein component [Gilvimarinus polysaccharolyticus]
MSSYAFTKAVRLLKSADFQAVFANAPYRASHQHLLILSRANNLDHARLGLVIGKKNIRLAVNRNYVKRHIRESFRHHQQQLQGLDVIVLARKGMDECDGKSIEKMLAKQWQRIARKRDQAAATPQDTSA